MHYRALITISTDILLIDVLILEVLYSSRPRAHPYAQLTDAYLCSLVGESIFLVDLGLL